MSIVCPNCDTHFVASKEQIGIAGRKVKCSQCQHIWNLKMDFSDEKLDHYNKGPGSVQDNIIDNVSPNAQNDVVPESTQSPPYIFKSPNLPVLLPNKPIQCSYITFFLNVSLIILLLLLLFCKNSNIPALYKQNNDIVIDNITIEKYQDVGRISVSYNINNNTNHNITIPLIRVRLLDQNSKTVNSYIMQQKNIKLGAKQKINMTTNLDIIPKSSKFINIMLGNSLDFILD